MPRIALIITSLLLLSYVLTILVLVAVGDTLRFITLISSSLVVPGAVFGAAAVVRRRRIARRGSS
ncbi:MAG: hypothetical protein JWM18_3022 [Chloroflexi bacterium]|nr:hypothetical protein [Chloroflexota bacterium]